uniref:Uncharacterized protein n=1 Tax=Arundo donax TaxID=35708 RepID=A0A0A9FGF9_ARUDO
MKFCNLQANKLFPRRLCHCDGICILMDVDSCY